MSDLKTAIEKAKRAKGGAFNPEDFQSAIVKLAETIIEEKLPEIIDSFLTKSSNINLEEIVIQRVDDTLITKLQSQFGFPSKFKGEKGDSIQGPQGPVGPKPRAGIDYTIPKEGPPGKDGLSIKGDSGKDGSPDTPEQVVSKVNRAETKIKKSRIDGLEEQFAFVMRAIKENVTPRHSGGGMGNWLHEPFALTSGTTSITVSTNIAANGMAHLLRYQGQSLAYGSQYTVTGRRKFNLLFTPEDGTVADVTFVRA